MQVFNDSVKLEGSYLDKFSSDDRLPGNSLPPNFRAMHVFLVSPHPNLMGNQIYRDERQRQKDLFEIHFSLLGHLLSGFNSKLLTDGVFFMAKYRLANRRVNYRQSTLFLQLHVDIADKIFLLLIQLRNFEKIFL